MGNPSTDTRIVCTSSLNGSDNYNKNDLVCGLNFDGPANADGSGYRFRNVGCQDLTFDGRRQSTSGIPSGATAGYSLAGVELMNIDDGFIRRCHFIGIYGNAAVISTEDPRQFLPEAGGTNVQNGIRNPIIEDCLFTDCVRGLMPQYGAHGYAGYGWQIGSGYGGCVRRNTALRTGGPFGTCFNVMGLSVTDNYVADIGLSAVAGGQGMGTIRGEFGLVGCEFSRNQFFGTGGIFLTGDMTTDIFTSQSLPGPQGCTIDDNEISQPSGHVQLASLPVGASGATYTNTYKMTTEWNVNGGAGVTTSIQRGGVGNFTPITLGPSSNLALGQNDVLQVNYTTPPANILVYAAPNIFFAGITIQGGSAYNLAGQALDNKVRGNRVYDPGTDCLQLQDASANEVSGNTLVNPGRATKASFVDLLTSYDISGAGSSYNNIHSNHHEERRASNNVVSNYADDMPTSTPRCLYNRVTNNRFETAVSTIITNSSTTFFAGNKGPGAIASPLGPLKVVSSGVFLRSPHNHDAICFVAGGTVTRIQVGPQNALQDTGMTSGPISVRHGEGIVVTYTTAPSSMLWFASH